MTSFTLDLGKTAAPVATAPANKKPNAQIWLNVGYDWTNPESGETVFVSIPLGIALDTRDAVDEKGSTKAYRDMRQAQNKLLKDLQDGLLDHLTPGQTIDLSQLKIQARRVNAHESTAEGENPMIASMPVLDFTKAA